MIRKFVGLDQVFTGVETLLGAGVPSGAVAGGVDVDGDEDDVRFAEGGVVRRGLWLGVGGGFGWRFLCCRLLRGMFRLGSVCRGC